MTAIYSNKPLPLQNIRLLDRVLLAKRAHNRSYLMELRTEHLLRNHYIEAGLWQFPDKLEDGHWGWESPTSQLRGHFLGHWLSAAAMMTSAEPDPQLLAKAKHIVSELRRCQAANGGQWVGAVPPVYMERLAKGQAVWVPQYNLHKTFMGLIDMYRYAGSDEALQIAVDWAAWFDSWVKKLNREQLDNLLDAETGGMLEVWADLYGYTKDETYLRLMQAYTRSRLFDPLLQGEDVLTNKHGNTTIPEIHGAARAYETTGDQRWRRIVEAYWKSAVAERGSFCTGGQTSGEVWTPPMQLAARLGDRTQEHCSVYNLMRLADILFQWTGEKGYADYIERNLRNGIMAQGYVPDYSSKAGEAVVLEPEATLIAYYLPLRAGSRKIWGSRRNHFWCCHGSLVQANATHTHQIYYEAANRLTVAQFIDSELQWDRQGAGQVRVKLEKKSGAGDIQRIPREQAEQLNLPRCQYIVIEVQSETPQPFELAIRLPWWVQGQPVVTVNGEQVTVDAADGFIRLSRAWMNDRVTVEFPLALQSCPLPGEPDKVAFLYGPDVLAGLVEDEYETTLYGDTAQLDSLLAVDDEREWSSWNTRFRTINQYKNIRFMQLNRISNERYTVYFPVRPNN